MTTASGDETHLLNPSSESSGLACEINPLVTSSLPSPASPSPDDIEELLLDCRYGDLGCVQDFVDKYGPEALAKACDGRGNTVLHMCAANGHAGAFQPMCTVLVSGANRVKETLSYLLSLPRTPVSLLTSTNDAGNTPLHWACLNGHVECVRLLVNFRPEPDAAGTVSALGPALISIRNNAGQTPLGEALRAGWEDGAQWLVSVMDLQPVSETSVDGEEVNPGDTQGSSETELPGSYIGEKSREEIRMQISRLNVSEDSPGR